jgi:hypothetical protein
MKALPTIGLETLSVGELHSAVQNLAEDAPILVMLDDAETVVPVERIEWDDDMQCYVLHETRRKGPVQ